MGFPTSVFSPTTKNNGDVVQASHINDLQTEVTAIETAALSGSWTVPNQPRMMAIGILGGGGQSISSSQSTGVRLSFPIVSYDVGGGWSTTTNQYTTPSSGLYFVNVQTLTAQGDPIGFIGVYLNNSLQTFMPVSTLSIAHGGQFFINANAGASIHVAAVMASTAARAFGITSEQYQQIHITKLC